MNINNEGHGSMCQVHTQAEDQLKAERTRTSVGTNN